MKTLEIQGTAIDDTFAEAFGMRYARILVTAHDEYWLEAAVREATGYASSVIACDAEAGLERRISAADTPDGRPGAAVLLFGFSEEALGKAVRNRVGQCVMTCPTTAVFDGLPESERRAALGKHLRFFGDGFQKSKKLGRRRFWRVPVMDGEFVVEDRVGIAKGVAGGNLVFQGRQLSDVLDAARRAVAAVASCDGAITPFPGGIARSGSKVGSQYPGLKASTAEGFCPSLRGRVESKLHPEAAYAVELVIDGIDESTVARAMKRAIVAAADPTIVAISAGNYGGKLGKYTFPLHRLLVDEAA